MKPFERSKNPIQVNLFGELPHPSQRYEHFIQGGLLLFQKFWRTLIRGGLFRHIIRNLQCSSLFQTLLRVLRDHTYIIFHKFIFFWNCEQTCFKEKKAKVDVVIDCKTPSQHCSCLWSHLCEWQEMRWIVYKIYAGKTTKMQVRTKYFKSLTDCCERNETALCSPWGAPQFSVARSAPSEAEWLGVHCVWKEHSTQFSSAKCDVD